jgi:hypothetical protein
LGGDTIDLEQTPGVPGHSGEELLTLEREQPCFLEGGDGRRAGHVPQQSDLTEVGAGSELGNGAPVR